LKICGGFGRRDPYRDDPEFDCAAKACGQVVGSRS
jgi:hypothetical protein